MKARQQGIAGMQMIIAVCVVAAVSVIAMPKYTAFMDKSKITEAFNLAGASKRKLSEFYILNNRFPNTTGEAETMKTGTLSPPKFVDRMEVEPGFKGHEVAIKVYLKDGVVENLTSEEQFIYISGDSTPGSDSAIAWTCGFMGIDPELMPDNCQG
jgi:Tfp pilus assembly protein PilE